MRTILFLGLAIGAAFMANWFTIERDGDRTRIDINKEEIRNDAQHAIEKGREILDKREHGQQVNAPFSEDAAPAKRSWTHGTPAQSTGYREQGANGNQSPYGEQNYGGQRQAPTSGGQPYETQAPTYPASARTPPPWQR